MSDVAGRTVADVMHADIEGLPASVTVGQLRAWFAISASRRLAVLASDNQYVAALTPANLATDAPEDRPALDFAVPHPTIAPGMPAAAGRDLAIATTPHRVPVVDDDGHLHGVLALTTDLKYFACRPTPAPTSSPADA